MSLNPDAAATLLLGAVFFAATFSFTAVRAIHDSQRLPIGALRLRDFRDGLLSRFLRGFELDGEFFKACDGIVVRGQSDPSMRVRSSIVTVITDSSAVNSDA